MPLPNTKGISSTCKIMVSEGVKRRQGRPRSIWKEVVSKELKPEAYPEFGG